MQKKERNTGRKELVKDFSFLRDKFCKYIQINQKRPEFSLAFFVDRSVYLFYTWVLSTYITINTQVVNLGIFDNGIVTFCKERIC